MVHVSEQDTIQSINTECRFLFMCRCLLNRLQAAERKQLLAVITINTVNICADTNSRSCSSCSSRLTADPADHSWSRNCCCQKLQHMTLQRKGHLISLETFPCFLSSCQFYLRLSLYLHWEVLKMSSFYSSPEQANQTLVHEGVFHVFGVLWPL